MSKRLEHNALPNLEELKKFNAGALDPKRMQEIDSIANENPLLKESIEGYAATGIFIPLPIFEHTGLSALGTEGAAVTGSGGATSGVSSGAGSSAATTSVSSTGVWTGITKSVVGYLTATKITVAAIICAGTGYMVQQKLNNTEQHQPAVEVEKTQDEDMVTPNQGTQGSDHIQSSKAQTSANQGLTESATSTLATTPTHEQQITSEQITADGGMFTIDPIEKPKVQPEAPIKNELPNNRGQLVGVGMTEVLNYRIADYTDQRKSDWSNNVFSEGHTPANQERHSQVPLEETKLNLSYLQFIGECMGYYDQKQYKQALEGFNLLAKDHPDDVNAQFYGGMSHFYMGNFSKAIEMFQKSETNAMRPFREDAKFYRAMALKGSGRSEDAKMLLNEIVSANGFYSKRALGELSQ